MQLKRRKPPKMSVRQSERVRCEAHLQWVRGHECAAAVGQHHGRIQAAHIRMGTDGAMGEKPGDNWTVPLCESHHREQHTKGERTFWAVQGAHPHIIATYLWNKSPAGIKYRQRILEKAKVGT